MQQLQPDVHYIGKGRDEIAILGNNVNRLYDNLRRTIQSLERENAHITRLEKEKLAFLHAACPVSPTTWADELPLARHSQFTIPMN